MLHSAKVISPCVISRRAARDSLRGCADLRAPGAFAGRMTGRSPRARRARVRVTRRTIPVGQYCEAARRPPYFGTPQCSVRGWRSWFRGSLVRSCVVRTAANGARRSRLIRCWIACSGAAACAAIRAGGVPRRGLDATCASTSDMRRRARAAGRATRVRRG